MYLDLKLKYLDLNIKVLVKLKESWIRTAAAWGRFPEGRHDLLQRELCLNIENDLRVGQDTMLIQCSRTWGGVKRLWPQGSDGGRGLRVDVEVYTLHGGGVGVCNVWLEETEINQWVQLRSVKIKAPSTVTTDLLRGKVFICVLMKFCVHTTNDPQTRLKTL